MERILFVARESSGVSTGASLITERNLKLLIQLNGENNVFKYLLDQNITKPALLLNLFQWYMSGLTSQHTEQILESIRVNQITHVFIDNSLLGKLAKKIKSTFPEVKVSLFFHNVEQDYFNKLMHESGKYWHLLSVFSVKLNEKLGVRFADELLFLNRRDANRVVTLYNPGSNVKYRILPSSLNDRFEINRVTHERNVKTQILFVGTLFFSNIHGIRWFVNEVMPYVEADLVIVGRGFEKLTNELSRENVRVIGTVKDTDSYYYQSDIVVAPIFKGSGMKTKLAEAFMFGKKILATTEAFEGYDINIHEIGEVCNTAQEFIKAINTTKHDKFLKSSREVFLKKYDSNSLRNEFTQPAMGIDDLRILIFAELGRSGLVHTKINSSIINLFKKLIGNSNTSVWAEKLHLDNLTVSDVSKFKIRVWTGTLGFGLQKHLKLILREIGFAIGWFRVLFFARKVNPKFLVITSVSPIVHFIIKSSLFLIPKNTKIFVVLHGEIENISKVGGVYYRFLELALKQKVKKGIDFKYVVLADYIKHNCVNEFSLSEQDLIAIPHPYSFKNRDNYQLKERNKIITFGSIGVQTTVIKQSHLIYQLAERFENEISDERIRFKIIGKQEEDMRPYASTLVEVVSGQDGMLSQDSYDAEISSLDYLLFFAPSGSYKFIASGTALDALNFYIPIVGLHNENLDELFKNAGSIGYLADNLDEMADIIRMLIDKVDDEEYNLIRQRMNEARNLFSEESVLNSLKLQIEI